MRIEIPNYDEVLVIDNEDLNNDHLVNISIERGDETIIATEAISLNELIAALEMFRQLRLLNREAFGE